MSANYIYNETLGGVIDGVNVDFTTLNNIDRIEEVYLGGVAYRDVTFSGNVITFADAPPIGVASPTADYFIAGVTPSIVTGTVTFLDIITDTYEKMGSIATSKVYPLNQIKRQINKGWKRIRNMKAYKDKGRQYTFVKAIDQEAIGYSATTITIADTPNVPTSGALLLGDSSFVTYDAYTNGIFSASAGYEYRSGDRVTVGYKIPTGVKRPSEIMVDRTVLTYVDNREFRNFPGHYNYTIIKDEAGDEFIFLPFRASDNIVTVKYTVEMDVLENDADLIDIIYEYSDVLSLYAAYNVLLLREDDRWQPIKQEYIELLKDYKSYKSKAVDGINNKFGTTPLVRGGGIARRSTFT